MNNGAVTKLGIVMTEDNFQLALQELNDTPIGGTILKLNMTTEVRSESVIYAQVHFTMRESVNGSTMDFTTRIGLIDQSLDWTDKQLVGFICNMVKYSFVYDDFEYIETIEEGKNQ